MALKQREISKNFQGQAVDIRVYFYQHSQGLFIYYKNQSKDLVLLEEMAFVLDNCHIEGVN